MTDDRQWTPWPSGLLDIELFSFLQLEEFDLDSLLEDARDIKGARVQDRRFSMYLSGWPSHAESHAHLIIREDDDWVEIDVSIHSSRPTTQSSLTLESLSDFLAKYLQPEDGMSAGTIAEFKRPVSEWHSTVPLPITLPGMLDSAAGSPEVVAFEFGYKDPTSAIRRAYVGIYDSEYFSLRLNYSIQAARFDDLLNLAVREADSLSGRFLTPLLPTSTSTSNE